MNCDLEAELDALRRESELLDRIHHRAVAHILLYTSDDDEDDEMSSARSADITKDKESTGRGGGLSLPPPSSVETNISAGTHQHKAPSFSLQGPLPATIMEDASSGARRPPSEEVTPALKPSSRRCSEDTSRLQDMERTLVEYKEKVDNLTKANGSLREIVSGLERDLADSNSRNADLQRLLEESKRRERDKSVEVELLEADLQRVTQDLAAHLSEASSLRNQVEELSPMAQGIHDCEVKERRLVSLLCRHRVLLLRAQHRLASQTKRYTAFVEKIADLTRGICGANLGISVGLDELQTEVSSMRQEMLEARMTLQQSHNDKVQLEEENILTMSQQHAEETATWEAERQQHLQAAVAWLEQKKAFEKKKIGWKEEKKKLLKDISDLKSSAAAAPGGRQMAQVPKRSHIRKPLAPTLHQCVREILQVQRGQLVMKMMLRKKNEMHTVNARYDTTTRRLLWYVPGDIGPGRGRGVRIEDVIRIDFGVLARAYMLHRPIGYSSKRKSASLPSYKCFTLWTAERSYDFYSSNLNIVCCFVIALSRLCTNAKRVALTRSQFFVEVVKAKMDEYCRAHRTTRIRMILDGIAKVTRRARIREDTLPVDGHRPSHTSSDG
ncbi:hypothetical protein FOZ61_002330 [Perkinsus olseni]|uniref:Uncharacterized protein n=1 Tax=Perkinsus olseni TaxID=32597 RepID=A0A7J6LUF1_PEROL|nr:hypothetical protein FOZ61_002330 [Perkinsus olseni]